MELLEQFEPAHSRQIGVDQQAGGFAGIKGFEKGLAACIGLDDAAVVFEHRAYRLANEVVVVDDDDRGSARSARAFMSVMRRQDQRLGRLRQELLDRARQIVQFDGFVEMNAIVKGDIAQGVGRNVAGENDEWNSPIELLPQFLGDLNPVHAVWQIVVGEDQIGPHRPARHRFQSSGAVDGRRRLIALIVQEQLEVLAHFRVVLNDQDRSGCAAPFASMRLPPRAAEDQAPKRGRLASAEPRSRRPIPFLAASAPGSDDGGVRLDS